MVGSAIKEDESRKKISSSITTSVNDVAEGRQKLLFAPVS
jgi:hypothetical protein